MQRRTFLALSTTTASLAAGCTDVGSDAGGDRTGEDHHSHDGGGNEGNHSHHDGGDHGHEHDESEGDHEHDH